MREGEDREEKTKVEEKKKTEKKENDGRSLTYSTKRSGPRTDPCGTPEEMAWQEEMERSTFVQMEHHHRHAGSSSSTLKEGHQIPETSFFLVEQNDQHGRKLSKRPKTERELTSQHPAHTAIPRSPRAVAKLLIDGVESRTAGPE